jgi:MoaA/NifB/PqqE/SkfB family radical SAM enzyme
VNSDLHNSILDKLKNTQISDVQIDPFGYCNAKCWFCPVSTHGNMLDYSRHMDVDVLENILFDIDSEKSKDNGIISKRLRQIHTAHYNEILLYKHFEEFLIILSKFKLKMLILSNGVNLTPEKIDIINKYKDSISGIYLNIPAFERSLWSERTGMNEFLFDSLISNLKYAEANLVYFTQKNSFSIGVNCPTYDSLSENGGIISSLSNFPNIDLRTTDGELDVQIKQAKLLFPSLRFHPETDLYDRAGLLQESSIISNLHLINKNNKKYVTDCSYGPKGRTFGWLNINSKAETFLCCNDFKYEYVFGNMRDSKLSEIWFSDKHVNTINSSFSEICTRCIHSVWADQRV